MRLAQRLGMPPRHRLPVVPSAERFDYPAFPSGWICVAYDREIARGEVKPVRCAGRELVLFRGDDGKVRALDAHCPHLGAHLGVGGRVEGNELRCPFHGWRFDGKGACTRIPHARKIPPRARASAWAVREANGFVFVWHDREGRPPWFEIPAEPEHDSPEWSRPHRVEYTIRSRWRELSENAVDRAHFAALHAYPEPPELAFETDGPRYSMRSKVRWKRFGRAITLLVDIHGHGPFYVRTEGRSEAPFLVLGGANPVDEDTVHQRLSIYVSKRLPWPLRNVLVRLVQHSLQKEFERDIPIWENKIALRRPVLSEGDGPIMRLRAWSEQFFGAAPRASIERKEVAPCESL
jgi:nitrite reductase/ring-hydroxylating ferredoxin subunit